MRETGRTQELLCAKTPNDATTVTLSGDLSKLTGQVAESGPVHVHAVVRRQLVILSSSILQV